jgi:VWFA-related protein
MRTVRLGALLAAVVLLARVPQAQTPQFRAGTELVVVDVVATRADGYPASDLTVKDFEVYEDGQQQAIRTFQLVDLVGIDRAADPAGVFSNQAEPGAVFALVMDELSVQSRYTRALRQWAQRFVDQHTRPHDYLGVMTTGSDFAMLLTRDRDTIRNRIARASGRGTPLAAPTTATGVVETTTDGEPTRPDFSALDQTDPGAELRATTERVVDTLRQVVDYLAAIPARRKSVMLFTQGIAPNLEALADSGAARGFVGMERLLDASRAGNVAIYGIDPRALPFDDDSAMAAQPQPALIDFGIDGLRDLARITGGRALVNRSDLDTALGRIAQENRTYFLLGYEPPRAGGSHLRRIEVKTRAPGVELLYRTARVLPREQENRAARTPATTPLPGGTLPVALAPTLYPTPDGQISVAVPFELGNGLPENQKVEYQLVAVDERGRQRAGLKGTVPAREGSSFGLARLSLETGRYQLRLHATSHGQEGLALADFKIPPRGAASPVCGGFLLVQRVGQALRPNVTRRFRRDAPVMIAAVVSSRESLKDAPVSFAAVPRNGRGELFFQVKQAPAVGPGMWRYELTLPAPLPAGQLDVVLVAGDTEIPGCRAELIIE